MQVISHPWMQRLRRIHQMAMAQMVYPGAVHTRFHHALGAYHLMRQALHELKLKGFEITPAEEQGAQLGILLHDAGHGPYSHALEGELVQNVHHENLSLQIMHELNRQFDGQLDTAIEIFTGNHPKKFLHQLISGQLDVDRMDYLSRDSFFTGVSEGMIAYDRILKMLTVHNGELMVEEKAIFSIEKFLVSRRLMYWQVYLHKTVLAAEQMLVRIIRRAKQVGATVNGPLDHFLQPHTINDAVLDGFCRIDDVDIMYAIKQWQNSGDTVLKILCSHLLNRQLFKIKFLPEPADDNLLWEKRARAKAVTGLDDEAVDYLVFSGDVSNTTYKTRDERIHILFKDGSVKDISQVDNALIHDSLAAKVGKYYICHL